MDVTAVMLGSAAPAMRRRVGPLAWCALEALHERATMTIHGLIADVSVLALACELGVAKNTAHRAVKMLRSAGLVEHSQARASGGRFDAASYRLTISEDVLIRHKLSRPGASRRSRGPSPAARRPAVVGGFEEQLVLLPFA